MSILDQGFQPSLSPSVGYAIVIGIGLAFAVLMVGLTYLQK